MVPPPQGVVSMSVDQMETVAKKAAHEAVKDTMFLLGVDISDRDSLDSWQADRVFTRKQRESSELRQQSWIKSAIAVILGIGGTLIGGYLAGTFHLGNKQ